MNEEKAPLRVETWDEQAVTPKRHQHHYRIATSDSRSVRLCARCGVSWLLITGQNITSGRISSVYWHEINEELKFAHVDPDELER